MKISFLYPDLRIEKLADLSKSVLESYKVKTIFLDIDNTLVAKGTLNLALETIEWLNRMKRDFKLALISNNPSLKTQQIGRELGIEVLNFAMKPFKFRFMFWLKKHDYEEKIMMIGDQVFTDVLFAKNIDAISVLIKPISSKDHYLTQILRKIENLILHDKS